jgi:hypothetical protein
MLMPLTALAQDGTDSGGKPWKKPPIGDFGPYEHNYSTKPDWKITAFADLWDASLKRNPDLQFVISKLSFSDQSKAIITRWLVDLGARPPQHGPRLRPEVLPPADIDDESTPFYSGKLELLTKTGHVTPELVVGFVQMVEHERESLDKTFKQYISNDKETSASARTALLQIAGSEAMQRLDLIVAENCCPLKVDQPVAQPASESPMPAIDVTPDHRYNSPTVKEFDVRDRPAFIGPLKLPELAPDQI